MKSKEITITVKGIQHDISEECTENTYTGIYTSLADQHIVKYDEYMVDADKEPIADIEKFTAKNLVKISKDSVHITKKGAVNTQMYFEQGKKHHGVYQTPFGNFDMKIETEHLNISETSHTISIEILYTLSLNKCPVSKCTIHMQITGL